MNKNGGGPAFPIHPGMVIDRQGVRETQGMTLRDWFAGQALAGFLADPATADMTHENIAQSVYLMADAMLATRDTGDNLKGGNDE
jgi:hypothetical protein